MDKKIFAVVSLSILSFALFPAAAGAACNLASGKTYYTDGVSFFSDAACRQEMTAAQVEAGTAATSTSSAATGYVSTGNGNCRYSLAKKQYTDGVSFFADNKCTAEALNDEAAAAPAASTVSAPTQASALAPAAAQTAAVGAVSAQMTQRIAALEKKVDILMAVMTQILMLLAKK